MIQLLSLLLSFSAQAHVPVLLQPIEGSPIAGAYLSRSEVSRAVYSELTNSGDLATLSWSQPERGPSLLQLFSPKCESIPQYEAHQPAALLIRGEAPWKKQGETTDQFLDRVRKFALAELRSSYARGERPVYEEKHGGHSLWIGAEWKGTLEAGLYTLIVFAPDGTKGNFVVGMNEKEAWNADLQRYAKDILPKINLGLCDKKGFSGRLRL